MPLPGEVYLLSVLGPLHHRGGVARDGARQPHRLADPTNLLDVALVGHWGSCNIHEIRWQPWFASQVKRNVLLLVKVDTDLWFLL